MKRTFLITTIIFVLNSVFTTAQDIVTYMNVHLTDGTVVQYEDSKVCQVSFHQLDMSDPAVIDSLAKIQQGDYNADSLWNNCSISGAAERYIPMDNRLTTKDYIQADIEYIVVNKQYNIWIHVFENNKYKGVYKNGQCVFSNYVGISGIIDLKPIKQLFPSALYKITIFKDDQNSSISPTESTNVKMYNSIYYHNVYVPTIKRFNHGPILTFIDDDGCAESAMNWEMIYDFCGVKPSMALITNRIGKSSAYLSWEKINNLKQKGFEFISHTNSHTNITNLSDSALLVDLQTSINLLKQHNCNSNFLVYPGNKHNNSTDSIVSILFKGAFCGENRMNNFPLDKTCITRFSNLNTTTTIQIEDTEGNLQTVYPSRTEAELKSIINQTIEYKGWTVIMTHLYNSYNSKMHCNEEMRKSIINMIKYAQSKGVRIMTVSEAFDYFSNAEDNK